MDNKIQKNYKKYKNNEQQFTDCYDTVPENGIKLSNNLNVLIVSYLSDVFLKPRSLIFHVYDCNQYFGEIK